MSFSANVKSELCRPEVEKGCCALAEALGVLLYANTFNAEAIRIVTESREFAQRLPRLFQKGLGVRFDALPEKDTTGKLSFVMTDSEKIRHVFELCGFSAQTSVSVNVNFALLEKECCRRAFLRGAFLAGGSVTDPEKRYHLELSTTHAKVSRGTQTLLLEIGMETKQTERKGSSILYYKQSEAIEDFLALIGAGVSAMAVMSAKIEKDWRNGANRKTNCDSANVDKSVAAAGEQLAVLQKLEQAGVLETLAEKLIETARLRRENPEATLSELAELHEPPLSKSAVNHRLRKLAALAAQLP
ncbi:MAG: DNA-binding protein WhiA [Ruminococcaceae bacterium]|nr:DNA-binding protein WhiA [Oscillospiraceae bacterium]